MLQLDIQPALIDQVHDKLLGAIADGTLASGQRLTQESVAAMLGVSRQPVSHALQVLKRRGFLIEHGKRGLQVAPLDGRRIRELYLVREALDGLAARLAAQRVKSRRGNGGGVWRRRSCAGDRPEVRRTHPPGAADRCRCGLPLGDPCAFGQPCDRGNRRRPVAAFPALHGAGAVGVGRAGPLLGRARSDPGGHSGRRCTHGGGARTPPYRRRGRSNRAPTRN